MPSLYKPEFRSDPYDSRIQNLIRAREQGRWHKPRPWRSKAESQMIRRFVLLWFTCVDRNRPSARAWARDLGISHVWLLKLVKKFRADPNRMQALQRLGDPRFEELSYARERTEEMRQRGELRPPCRRHR